MLKQKLNSEHSKSICEIDTRLAELEEEKKQLLDIRKQLQKSSAIAPESSSYSPEQKISIFRNLFRGRTDIFASRWVNKQGRSGYSVACNNEWIQGICHKPRVKCQDCNHRQFTELTDQTIYRHLAGLQVVGLYPLMHDNTCFFLATDFDKGQWQEEVKAMSKACKIFEIPHTIEISLRQWCSPLDIFQRKSTCQRGQTTGFRSARQSHGNLSKPVF